MNTAARVREGFRKRMTLCWSCAKACGECSWSDYWEHSPVPGWTAEETRLMGNGGADVVSYCVTDCPEFVPDRRK